MPLETEAIVRFRTLDLETLLSECKEVVDCFEPDLGVSPPGMRLLLEGGFLLEFWTVESDATRDLETCRPVDGFIDVE